MPITEFLDGFKFDPEARRVMGVAYEMARAALKFDNRTYAADEIIAGRIIELAKTGVVDPDQLCEQALNDLRLRADSMIVSTSAASRFKASAGR
jgi:hypothetical protein